LKEAHRVPYEVRAAEPATLAEAALGQVDERGRAHLKFKFRA
jgi:hypothetical protein